MPLSYSDSCEAYILDADSKVKLVPSSSHPLGIRHTAQTGPQLTLPFHFSKQRINRGPKYRPLWSNETDKQCPKQPKFIV